MLCSKKMILPSKFNVKLQTSPGIPNIFEGGGGGYQHPTNTLWPCMILGRHALCFQFLYSLAILAFFINILRLYIFEQHLVALKWPKSKQNQFC
jgi:hypothetical protein